jgi:hypothetical protein
LVLNVLITLLLGVYVELAMIVSIRLSSLTYELGVCVDVLLDVKSRWLDERYVLALLHLDGELLGLWEALRLLVC